MSSAFSCQTLKNNKMEYLYLSLSILFFIITGVLIARDNSLAVITIFMGLFFLYPINQNLRLSKLNQLKN
jgi:hypothetical protein